MNIIHQLEDLSEEHQKLARSIMDDILYNTSTSSYRELEDTHPVRYSAPVIKALADEGMRSAIEDRVPQEVFADPQMVLHIVSKMPSLTGYIDESLLQQQHPVLFQIIEKEPSCLQRIWRTYINDAFIERTLSLPPFDLQTNWSYTVKESARSILVHGSDHFWTQERACALAHKLPHLVKSLPKFEHSLPVQLEVVKQLPEHYRDLPWLLKSDPAMIQHVLTSDGTQLEHAPYTVQSDPQWAQLAIQSNPLAYQYVDHAIAVQPEVALGVLRQADASDFGDVLSAVPKRLRADIRWCHQLLDIVEHNPQTIGVSRYIDPSVLVNDGFTQRLCTLQPDRLNEVHQHHPRGIWHLEEHAARMCAQYPELLRKAPLAAQPAFCRKVLDSALSNPNLSSRRIDEVLQHMSTHNIEVTSQVYEQLLSSHPSTYANFPEEVKRNPAIVLALLKTDTEDTSLLREAFKHLPATTFENNEPLLHTFLSAFMNPNSSTKVDERFRLHEIRLLTEIYLVPDVWMNQIKNDEAVAERFMEHHPKLYPFLSEQLKEKPEFFERYLGVTKGQVDSENFPKPLRAHPHYALMAVQKNPSNYSYLGGDMRKQPDIAWEYATNAYTPGGVPDALKNDTQWVLKVCEQRQDAKMVECSTPSIKGLVTKTLNQLRQSDRNATMKDAALYLAAKRTAQADHKALKSAFKDAPRPVQRPSANKPMGRAL